MPSQIPCDPLIQRFPRMFSKFASVNLRGRLFKNYYILTRLEKGTTWAFVAVFSEFWECSQNSRNRLPYTAPFILLTTKHHDILMFGDGGALAKAKGGAKRKV